MMAWTRWRWNSGKFGTPSAALLTSQARPISSRNWSVGPARLRLTCCGTRSRKTALLFVSKPKEDDVMKAKSRFLPLLLLVCLSTASCASVRQSLNTDGSSPRAHLEQGDRLFKLKQYQNAIAEFRSAVQGNPRSA